MAQDHYRDFKVTLNECNGELNAQFGTNFTLVEVPLAHPFPTFGECGAKTAPKKAAK